MNKAIFLDRDGVINKDNANYTYRVEDFILLDGVLDVLQILRDKGYLFIVITNQAGIARNVYTHNDVARVHEFLLAKLSEQSILVSEIYYCPHYTETGNCICRKPDSLLIEKALARFSIDAAQSYFIGDRNRDIEAAAKAGVRGIKVDTDVDLRTILHLIK